MCTDLNFLIYISIAQSIRFLWLFLSAIHIYNYLICDVPPLFVVNDTSECTSSCSESLSIPRHVRYPDTGIQIRYLRIGFGFFLMCSFKQFLVFTSSWLKFSFVTCEIIITPSIILVNNCCLSYACQRMTSFPKQVKSQSVGNLSI